MIMKKILLVSDTHGTETLLQTILKERGPYDRLIFLGDGCGLENRLFNMAGCPAEVNMVRGNCDWGSSLPEEAVITVGKYRVLITHGNRWRVNCRPEPLSYHAEEVNVQMCFFGHTHVPCMENIGGILLVNPGSLTRPRQDGMRPTFYEIEEDEAGELAFSLVVL